MRFSTAINKHYFCKIYDEKYTAPEEIVRFRAELTKNPKDLRKANFGFIQRSKN